jgi:hypothetical protein
MFKKVSDTKEVINRKILSGGGFSGIYLNVSLDRLLEVFGQPTKIGSGDNKVQLEWMFYDIDSQASFTIYDYKSNTPIHKINDWHVGRKGTTNEEIIAFLIQKEFEKDNEIVLEN